jgi:hypothetical protein
MNPLRTINIKGKPYVEVVERLKAFRENFPDYALTTEVVQLTPDYVVLNAIITDPNGRIVASGLAQEDRTSSMINKTSYVENCESSAWGRALGNFGIGLQTAIATADEMAMAIAKQQAGINLQPVRQVYDDLLAEYDLLLSQLPEAYQKNLQSNPNWELQKIKNGITYLKTQLSQLNPNNQ